MTGTRHTAEINGLQLHVEIRGEGTPLLLLHGFTGCGQDWHHVFPDPPAGYRLIAPDLRGHGRSLNPSKEFSFRQCGVDVLGLLDRLGLERVSAIGLSGGGQTLLHVGTSAPERVSSQVLVSTAPYFPPEARALMARLDPEAMDAKAWQEMRQRHPHGDAQIRALWEHGRSFKDSYDDVHFTRSDLGRIRAATLIVHGDRDPFYPPEVALEMLRAIGRASLWIIPDAAHSPIFGGQAPEFRRRVLEFFSTDPAGANVGT